MSAIPSLVGTPADPSAPVGAGWARERLWLGMSNVGTWVVLAVAGLLLGAPELGLGVFDPVVLALGLIAVQAPFDLVGGYLLPRRHGRDAPTAGRALLAWGRGVVVHTLFAVVAGLTAVSLFAWLGAAGVVLGAAALAVIILGLQAPILALTSGLRLRPLAAREAALVTMAGLDPTRVRQVRARDRSLVGGWLGLPGAEILVVPTVWQEALPAEARVAQYRRRAVARQSGQRVRGVLLALGFTLVGAALAAGLAGGTDLDAVIRMGSVFTLWSFLGLLLLPTPSRRGVYAVDADTVRAGVEPGRLAAALGPLDALQDDEPARSDLVETIFHPVPALARRRARLARSEPAPTLGAWHAARVALLLGWSLGSPLSRAVHCNIGRPELWAALPGD